MQENNECTKKQKNRISQTSHPTSDHRGITLIALIITIIVMIILVGVTVNVALNGELFKTAQNAAQGTQIETDRETLQVGVVSAMASETGISKESLIDNLPSGWEVKKEGPFTVISPKENVFIVSTDGTIKYKEPSTGDLLLLEKYFLGENLEGRNLEEMTLEDSGTIIFLDEEATIPDASTTIRFLNSAPNGDSTKLNIYVVYKNIVYKIIVNYITIETESIEEIYKQQGNEGKNLGEVTGEEKYNGWIILYDNGETLEAISPEVMGNLKLGSFDDPTVNWEDSTVITEANVDGEEELSRMEKSIYLYNHAIERINNYCENLKDLPNNLKVRSVGAAIDPRPNLQSNNVYNEIPEEWSDSKYNGKGKKGDEAYEQDLIRMSYFGVDNIGADYWVASRRVIKDSETINFSVYHYEFDLEEGSGLNSNFFWYVTRTGGYGTTSTFPVRPIITIQTP